MAVDARSAEIILERVGGQMANEVSQRRIVLSLILSHASMSSSGIL